MQSRAALGWALLFAIPPGVGVTGYAAILSGERLVGPTSLTAGFVTAGAIFALVYGSQRIGSAEPTEERDRLD
jgi:hypothetical protein